jgi:endogenous inhibitor of DNA gyrase (YacG/DUF329 family)
MPKDRAALKCPTCKKQEVTSADPDFPFCSERCRLIDLGKWASGGYVISSPLQDNAESIRDSAWDSAKKDDESGE